MSKEESFDIGAYLGMKPAAAMPRAPRKIVNEIQSYHAIDVFGFIGAGHFKNLLSKSRCRKDPRYQIRKRLRQTLICYASLCIYCKVVLAMKSHRHNMRTRLTGNTWGRPTGDRYEGIM